jgi:hypothetical protein
VITVFTSPAPLSAGPADISVLLQNRNGLDAVLDANVSLMLRAGCSDAESQAHSTQAQARNKLLYAAPVNLAEAGKWKIAVTVLRNCVCTDVTGTIDVGPLAQW